MSPPAHKISESCYSLSGCTRFPLYRLHICYHKYQLNKKIVIQTERPIQPTSIVTHPTPPPFFSVYLLQKYWTSHHFLRTHVCMNHVNLLVRGWVRKREALGQKVRNPKTTTTVQHSSVWSSRWREDMTSVVATIARSDYIPRARTTSPLSYSKVTPCTGHTFLCWRKK